MGTQTANTDLFKQATAATGKEVIISAEGAERTSSIHEIYRTVYAQYPILGVSLQETCTEAGTISGN
jgi:hypothetical protein